jgi:hypothetical protein
MSRKESQGRRLSGKNQRMKGEGVVLETGFFRRSAARIKAAKGRIS